ncbi:hypothetical protein AALP_AA8G283100 [Arabis alpina]|uniref:Uncharacterized protein n=1 Tax=Arabis alpina TaxID=50452 RepID=A0A087GA07_ARAAL|nr:hypothetical protein AALP_AA8G283100 [Arabis alpina]
MVHRSGLTAMFPILAPRSSLVLTATSSQLQTLPKKTQPPDPPIPPDPPPLSWLVFHDPSLRSYTVIVAVLVSPEILVPVRDQKTKLLKWPLFPLFPPSFTFEYQVSLLMVLLLHKLSSSRGFGVFTLVDREHIPLASGKELYSIWEIRLPLSLSYQRYVQLYFVCSENSQVHLSPQATVWFSALLIVSTEL